MPWPRAGLVSPSAIRERMGDGDITVMPPYDRQSDLTDKGAPKGKSFHFTMDSATA